jgi:hypothetical protein
MARCREAVRRLKAPGGLLAQAASSTRGAPVENTSLLIAFTELSWLLAGRMADAPAGEGAATSGADGRARSSADAARR